MLRVCKIFDMPDHMNTIKAVSLFIFLLFSFAGAYTLIYFAAHALPEYWPGKWRYFPASIAVFTGALIGQSLLKTGNINLYHRDYFTAIFFLLLPVVIFTITGLDNKLGIDRHSYALVCTSVLTVYALLMEYGWRGFLFNTLQQFPPFLKYFVAGLLVCIWYYPLDFYMDYGSMTLILLSTSFISGYMVDRSGSFISAIPFHVLFVIAATSPEIQSTWYIPVIVLAVLILLFYLRFKKIAV